MSCYTNVVFIQVEQTIFVQSNYFQCYAAGV